MFHAFTGCIDKVAIHLEDLEKVGKFENDWEKSGKISKLMGISFYVWYVAVCKSVNMMDTK